jgi:hypothetical protein
MVSRKLCAAAGGGIGTNKTGRNWFSQRGVGYSTEGYLNV